MYHGGGVPLDSCEMMEMLDTIIKGCGKDGKLTSFANALIVFWS